MVLEVCFVVQFSHVDLEYLLALAMGSIEGQVLNGSDSKVESSPFTIENIPYGVISTARDPTKRCATAFEDYAIDLRHLERQSLFQGITGFDIAIFADVGVFNEFFSLGLTSCRTI